MRPKLTKEEANKLLDKRISSILKRTSVDDWHSILNDLEKTIRFENRRFITTNLFTTNLFKPRPKE